MFQMHERTRRRWAWALLVSVGLIPAVGLFACGVVWRSSWHRNAEAARFQDRLTMPVAIGHLSHLSPGVVRYNDFKLDDPETGAAVLTTAELLCDGDNFRLDNPQINWDRNRPWRDLLLRQFKLMGLHELGPINIRADRLTLKLGNESLELVDFIAHLEDSPEGSVAKFTFRLADQKEGSDPICLRVGHVRGADQPVDWIELQTGPTSIVCRWLSRLVEPLGSLGDKARFSGYFSASQTPDGCNAYWGKPGSGEQTGSPARISQVDLRPLLGGSSEPIFASCSDWTFDSAWVHGGRIVSSSGSVEIGAGQISQSFLLRMVEHWRFVPSGSRHLNGANLPFESFALRFDLSDAGVKLASLTSKRNAPILSDSQGPILVVPDQASLNAGWTIGPVSSLIGLLADSDSSLLTRHDLIPNDPQAISLGSRLPLPKKKSPSAGLLQEIK